LDKRQIHPRVINCESQVLELLDQVVINAFRNKSYRPCSSYVTLKRFFVLYCPSEF
jgi:hypothetical protein